MIKDRRRKELAAIHIGVKQLALDRENYERMLWTLCRVHSAADLDAAGRTKVLEHMRSRGFKPHGRGRSRPANDRAALIAKIQAQLIALDRLPDSYADGIAQQMFGVNRYEWCKPWQLRKIIAALQYETMRAAEGRFRGRQIRRHRKGE